MKVLISDPKKLLKKAGLSQKEVRETARRILEREYRGDIPLSRIKVSLVFVDDEAMIPINRAYTGREGSTDVLSFPMMDEVDKDGSFAVLGEVIVSIDRALSQAKEAGWSSASEVKLLVIHGLLHLLGYDHVSEEESVKMRLKEKEYLI
ncbi:MAG: rRNA maturation RNase YbeY [Synergistetes bacterium]|nr:rRNA maturation RNase YbeY [Synergistota bacterium]MDW8191811.1 rRNA maturation RNase YbeY [Synergistota bacterium]